MNRNERIAGMISLVTVNVLFLAGWLLPAYRAQSWAAAVAMAVATAFAYGLTKVNPDETEWRMRREHRRALWRERRMHRVGFGRVEYKQLEHRGEV